MAIRGLGPEQGNQVVHESPGCAFTGHEDEVRHEVAGCFRIDGDLHGRYDGHRQWGPDGLLDGCRHAAIGRSRFLADAGRRPVGSFLAGPSCSAFRRLSLIAEYEIELVPIAWTLSVRFRTLVAGRFRFVALSRHEYCVSVTVGVIEKFQRPTLIRRALHI